MYGQASPLRFSSHNLAQPDGFVYARLMVVAVRTDRFGYSPLWSQRSPSGEGLTGRNSSGSSHCAAARPAKGHEIATAMCSSVGDKVDDPRAMVFGCGDTTVQRYGASQSITIQGFSRNRGRAWVICE